MNLIKYVVYGCLQVTPEEARALLNALVNPNTARQTGIHVNGNKYFYVVSDHQQVQGKKGQAGCSAAKAGKCEYDFLSCALHLYY